MVAPPRGCHYGGQENIDMNRRGMTCEQVLCRAVVLQNEIFVMGYLQEGSGKGTLSSSNTWNADTGKWVHLGVFLGLFLEVGQVYMLRLFEALEVRLVQRRLELEGFVPVDLLPIDGTVCAICCLVAKLQVPPPLLGSAHLRVECRRQRRGQALVT